MLKDIVGVYFDLFGTIIDSRYTLTTVWSRIAKKLGTKITPEDPRVWEGILKQYDEADKLIKESFQSNKQIIDFSREEIKKIKFSCSRCYGSREKDITRNSH